MKIIVEIVHVKVDMKVEVNQEVHVGEINVEEAKMEDNKLESKT